MTDATSKTITAGMISVERESVGYLVTHESGRTIFVQSDWDFPGLANTFGWDIARPGCPDACSGTDGTITCPACGTTVHDYIALAQEYLDAGPDPVEDPGYFDNTEE